MLAATISSFHAVSPTAAYLLVPYFGWSLYATALTTHIYKHNPRVRTHTPRCRSSLYFFQALQIAT